MTLMLQEPGQTGLGNNDNNDNLFLVQSISLETTDSNALQHHSSLC